MVTTEEWCKSLAISVEPTPPSIDDYSERCPRTARQIALRAMILHGVVAVASGVEAEPVIDWFQSLNIWRSVTPEEKSFLRAPSLAKQQCQQLAWHMEAEWTLLWVIGKVDSLGLPTRQCDSRRLCEEIVPDLGSDIAEFIDSVKLRSPGLLLAEDDRTYDIWCHANGSRRKRKPLPEDLSWSVLYERRYAFEWLDGTQDWDDVTCDA